MNYKLIAEPNSNYTPIEQILINRGVKYCDIQNYLRTTDEVLLEGTKLDNMAAGINLLVNHLKGDSKVFIQVDSDVDGYTSAALLYNYLYKLVPGKAQNIDFRIHEGKEHGIILDSILNKGYSLAIFPDAASNQYEEHKILSENGIDVLVIDHHECEHESEHAVVINNQLSENYENKSLSGVGVVYKFCKVIDKVLNINMADNYLDLVALGLVADMMDMRNAETKHLIQKGITSIQNPFFKGLVDRQAFSLGATITPIGLAFYIAPLINATVRVGTQQEKEIMFRAMLENSAYLLVPSTKRGHKGETETLVEQGVRNCINIKNRQKKMRDEGVAKIEQIIEEENLNQNQIIIVNTSGLLDKNLTGLVANQLMSKYKKPVLLLREVVWKDEDDKETITLQGSGRGYDKSEFNDFKGFLTDSDMFEFAEGHKSAFGASIKKDKIDNFIEYSNKELAEFTFDAKYEVDFIYDTCDLKAQDILDIATMKNLWGKGVEEAIIVIKGIKITKENITLMSPDRNPTLKITLPNGISLIKFGSNMEEYEKLCKDTGYTEIQMAGKCNVNEWQGNISPQVFIEEYEITNQCNYYF